jgi:hypothetical protein
MKLSDLGQSARELYFYASHNSIVHKAYVLPVFLNLQGKFKKGTFHYDLGIKLLRQYALVAVAKDYHREHGSMGQHWHDLFTIQDRANVAEVILDKLLCEFRNGNFYN